MSHLILYDDPCPLCNRFIQFIIKHDHKKKFAFASLKGKTAASFSDTFAFPEPESIVLIENYQTKKQRIYTHAQGVFKILWDLGGIWRLVGWKYILPSWMSRWFYQIIAKRRYKICRVCKLKKIDLKADERFLP